MNDTTVVLHTVGGDMFDFHTSAEDARGLVTFVTGCWNAGRSMSVQVANKGVAACVNTSHIAMITTSQRPGNGT
jgi:hypothetical protein